MSGPFLLKATVSPRRTSARKPEFPADWPSAATADVSPDGPAPDLDASEVRERMSGNLCRCGAYPQIVRAVLETASREEGAAVRISSI